MTTDPLPRDVTEPLGSVAPGDAELFFVSWWCTVVGSEVVDAFTLGLPVNVLIKEKVSPES